MCDNMCRSYVLLLCQYFVVLHYDTAACMHCHAHLAHYAHPDLSTVQIQERNMQLKHGAKA